jgi:hypothetical protein
MDATFVEVVETVKQLSIEEKLELRGLLDNYLVEERRDEISKNFATSLREESEGKLAFSSDLAELEAMFDD